MQKSKFSFLILFYSFQKGKKEIKNWLWYVGILPFFKKRVESELIKINLRRKS